MSTKIVLLLCICLFIFVPNAAIAEALQDNPNDLTPSVVAKRLNNAVSEQDFQLLVNDIRLWIGENNLKRPYNVRVEGLVAVWIVQSENTKSEPVVSSVDGKVKIKLEPMPGSNLYVASSTRPAGEYLQFNIEIDGKRIGNGTLEFYPVLPESLIKKDIPKGTLTAMPRWKSKVFEATERDWWVYAPSQYSDDKPACLMIFQDGGSYTNFVPTVFDNLIAKNEMPVTIAVFLNPGFYPDNRKAPNAQRSFEYDTLSPLYSRFLVEEIIPEVEKKYKLRKEASSKAIAGASSGGICAFTAAWERPDVFGKVVSWIGSFTGIASGRTHKEGGNNYPVIIRKTRPIKPIRVFLQDGENDLDNANGNWFIANQDMARALRFSGYDYQIVTGKGGHSMAHGRAIFPDTLRWLWRDVR